MTGKNGYPIDLIGFSLVIALIKPWFYLDSRDDGILHKDRICPQKNLFVVGDKLWNLFL